MWVQTTNRQMDTHADSHSTGSRQNCCYIREPKGTAMEPLMEMLTEFLRTIREVSHDQSRTMRAVLLTVVVSVALATLILTAGLAFSIG
ncbi:hypothetical protein GCM10022255_069720 [Dactylosporangium darangshiense]|uniref:Uncharacterized protein n=1 Tax=Dactylosporangium darangshiense TaxID=579108 RepID=A0ABP8DHW7_9ACTN